MTVFKPLAEEAVGEASPHTRMSSRRNALWATTRSSVPGTSRSAPNAVNSGSLPADSYALARAVDVGAPPSAAAAACMGVGVPRARWQTRGRGFQVRRGGVKRTTGRRKTKKGGTRGSRLTPTHISLRQIPANSGGRHLSAPFVAPPQHTRCGPPHETPSSQEEGVRQEDGVRQEEGVKSPGFALARVRDLCFCCILGATVGFRC